MNILHADTSLVTAERRFGGSAVETKRAGLGRRCTALVTRVGISRAEWIWVGAMTLLIVGLTLVPPTVGRLFGPQDRVHLGSFWYTGDFTQYLAAMREGAASPSWLVRDHFSSEVHEPVFMYPLYVAIGKLAAASDLPVMSAYAACELLMRLMLPLSVYLFMAAFLRTTTERRLGFVLAMFSGGLVFWLGLIQLLLSGDGGAMSINLTIAAPYIERFSFASFLAAPHIGLGLALTLLSVVCFSAACRGRDYAFPLLAGVIFLLALVHPFNLVVLPAVFLVYGLLETAIHRQVAWRPLLGAGLAAGVAAPFVLYNVATFAFSPFWSQTYGAQNSMVSPLPWELPLIFGIPFLLALLGIRRLTETWTTGQRLLVTLVAVDLALMYLPVPYQRRFGFGVQVAIAALAALAWPVLRSGAPRLVQSLRVPESRRSGVGLRLALYPLLILSFGEAFFAYANVVASATTNQPTFLYFVDRDTYQAGQWIADHSTEASVTAASFFTSSILGGLVPGRVVVGHPVATLGFRAKLDTMHELYQGKLSVAAAHRFLADNRVRYLVVGPAERQVGDVDPGMMLGLPVVQRFGDVSVYERQAMSLGPRSGAGEQQGSGF